jgi:hypothetical protein
MALPIECPPARTAMCRGAAGGRRLRLTAGWLLLAASVACGIAVTALR